MNSYNRVQRANEEIANLKFDMLNMLSYYANQVELYTACMSNLGGITQYHKGAHALLMGLKLRCQSIIYTAVYHFKNYIDSPLCVTYATTPVNFNEDLPELDAVSDVSSGEDSDISVLSDFEGSH